MKLVVFEDAGYRNLLPLVYARGVFDLRCGFDSLLDKIETAFGRAADALSIRGSSPALEAVLAQRRSRPVNEVPSGNDLLFVNGRLLVRRRFELEPDTAVWRGDTLLAARVTPATGPVLMKALADDSLEPARARLRNVEMSAEVAALIDYPWQLVHESEAEIARQFDPASAGVRGTVDPGAHLLDESNIHVGAGSRIKPGCVLDAEDGPIHLGENVAVGPNATLTGPCFIGDGCVIRPGANISGSSIGPVCKVGGEVEATIIHGHSNKQHDGFLGHSYVGQWVNLGADTVNSDLKNTYGPVRVPINGREIDSGETFVGAFIGDHSKTGINVALPTGCVIGHACNVFVSRYPPKFVPSFSWLTDDGLQPHDPARALAVARKVMARRNRSMSQAEQDLFLSIRDMAGRIEAPA